MAKKRAAKKNTIKETDLYPGVKTFLESLGYEVKGEVLDCDVTAVGSDGTLLAVELKLTLNIKLILQAVERLAVVDFVYLGIPDTDTFYKKNRRSIAKLLQRLAIGLMLVNTASNTVYPAIHPTQYKPKKQKKKRAQLLKEFSALNGDPNIGGSSTKTKKMTVYRQKALQIAAHLIKHGNSKASHIRDAVGIDNARDIMYQNHYKWFIAHGKGIYGISKHGQTEHKDWLDSLRNK